MWQLRRSVGVSDSPGSSKKTTHASRAAAFCWPSPPPRSAADTAYQVGIADRGVWLEFDMIGMDITFPKEGEAPASRVSAAAVAGLVEAGHGHQVLLSHDVFLKQMWTRHGGNGFAFVPTVFAEMLQALGVGDDWIETLTRANPARMLSGQDAGCPRQTHLPASKPERTTPDEDQ